MHTYRKLVSISACIFPFDLFPFCQNIRPLSIMTVDMGSSIDLAAVLQLSTRATQFSYSYACDVKCVLKIQKRYLRAVSALTEVLLSLKQAILNAESAGAAPVYPSLNGVILTDCYTELTLLYSDLQKRRLGYLPPFQDMELKPHVNMLRKFRALFTDFLSHITYVFTY